MGPLCYPFKAIVEERAAASGNVASLRREGFANQNSSVESKVSTLRRSGTRPRDMVSVIHLPVTQRER
jgi:hypothetical protein